jgi:hypothetical protein
MVMANRNPSGSSINVIGQAEVPMAKRGWLHMARCARLGCLQMTRKQQ